MTEAQPVRRVPESLLRIFLRFLHFGFLAWGGPVAQIAMIRKELVEGEQWVSSSYFNRLMAVYQVLPGPEAHELCVHLGMVRRGRLGGFLAGLGFMLPGFVLMFFLSWLYIAFQITQTRFALLFFGIQPAVVALVAHASRQIGKHVIRNLWMAGIAVVSAIAALVAIPFWITLPVAGLVWILIFRGRNKAALAAAAAFVTAVLLGSVVAGDQAAIAAQRIDRDAPASDGASIPILFGSGLRAGLLTFGGAYTVIPFLQYDAVARGGWMTNPQFLDGLALSGILPAPLIIFSTFVGYLGNGPWGALAMTIGVFIPAFSFALLFHRHLEKAVENPVLHTFFDGVTAGVVGLISATTVVLGRDALDKSPNVTISITILVVALAALYSWRAQLTRVVVILGAGLLGFLLFR